MINNIAVKKNKMKRLFPHFVTLKIWFIHSDRALSQYSLCLINKDHVTLGKIWNYYRKTQLLDTVFSKVIINISKYEEPSFVVKMVLTLSRRQVSVEEG